jgi:hypothetical protein
MLTKQEWEAVEDSVFREYDTLPPCPRKVTLKSILKKFDSMRVAEGKDNATEAQRVRCDGGEEAILAGNVTS